MNKHKKHLSCEEAKRYIRILEDIEFERMGILVIMETMRVLQNKTYDILDVPSYI